jgi:arylsulfatase/uncharacterized sulfatase
MIVAGASLPRQGILSDAFSFVTDIAPTILSLTGVNAPGKRFAGRPIEPIIGKNLVPLLRGDVDRIYSENDAVGYELAGNAALFQGDYKIVLNRRPLGDARWRLFNIKRDPGETHDLSRQLPERLQTMLSAYERYTADNKVLPMPPGYGHLEQLFLNTVRGGLREPLLITLITLLMLAPFYVYFRLRSR